MKVSRRRLDQLIKHCENYRSISKIKPKRGKINEVEFFLAYIDYIKEKHKLEKSKDSDLEKAQIRLRIAQAQKAEIDIAKENETLVPKEVSINFISNVFLNIRNKMLSSPNRIAFQVFGSKTLKEAKRKTEKIVNEFLIELSDPKTLYKKNKKFN